MKAAEALAIAAIILALGVDLPVSAAVVVLGAVNLATMLPVAPGNVGTYEAGAIAAYRWLGVAPEAALAAAIVQHLCFLLPAVGAGAVVLAVQGVERGGEYAVSGGAALPETTAVE
jgi:glycosyltransferase 2 family protein